MPRTAIDLTGLTFGRLTVLGPAKRPRGARLRWACRCACGTILEVQGKHLVSGATRSCRCLQAEIRNRGRHGHKPRSGASPEYVSWSQAKSRCFNPNAGHYADYGGRGITMCPEWRGSFEAFLRDMGNRPSPRHTLDRIDDDGPYAPGNCRWATWLQQQNNRRDNKRVIVDGRRLTMAQAAREYGLSYAVLSGRLSRAPRIKLGGVMVEVA